MAKKRILMCAESHDVNSGFGRYTYEIMSRLYKNENYEVAEFSSYHRDDKPNNVPWKVYPNEPSEKNQKEFELYKSNPTNQFGQWRFEKVVLDFKPDIVFDIRDYWMFAYQEISPLRSYFNWVVAPTVDSVPQKPEWLKTFENADIVLTHTDWAGEYLKSLNRSINIGPSVSDSVDSNTFKPIGHTKSYHKTKFGLPTDSFIIGAVMRNQKRKLIPELFKSLREILDKTKNPSIFLYLHTSFPEMHGWNIPELLQEFNVANNVLFTYFAPALNKVYVSTYKGPKIPCFDDPSTIAVFPNVVHGVSNKQLSEVYNLFDIYVQYAICEGLGIPQLEAASCGIPVFAIDYSGMEEITTKIDGTKLKYLLSKELETGAERATPDNEFFVNKVIEFVNLSKEERKQISLNTRKLLLENYSWDKTAQTLMSVFDSIEPKNKWNNPLETARDVVVPENLSNRDFISFIVKNILKEDRLLNTFYIQNLIRALDEGYLNIGVPGQFSRKEAIQILENYMNHKMFCEQIRSGQLQMTEDFLKYSES
jgi:glycosyltransferase involved in cell wall biosynthesis